MEVVPLGAESGHRSFTRISTVEMSVALGKGHELHEQRLTWDLGRRRRRRRRVKGEWFGQVGR